MPPELRSRTDLISMSAAARLFNVNIHTISDLTPLHRSGVRCRRTGDSSNPPVSRGPGQVGSTPEVNPKQTQ